MAAYQEQDQPERLPGPAAYLWPRADYGTDSEPPFAGLGSRARDADAWAMLAYMTGAVFGFGPPLLVYLLKLRGPQALRKHVAQAVNTSATMVIYLVCALIVGGLLALDSLAAALAIACPAAVALWLVSASYLVRAAVAASRGEFLAVPAWLCATIVRP